MIIGGLIITIFRIYEFEKAKLGSVSGIISGILITLTGVLLKKAK
jgi:hypothetical protein